MSNKHRPPRTAAPPPQTASRLSPEDLDTAVEIQIEIIRRGRQQILAHTDAETLGLIAGFVAIGAAALPCDQADEALLLCANMLRDARCYHLASGLYRPELLRVAHPADREELARRTRERLDGGSPTPWPW